MGIIGNNVQPYIYVRIFVRGTVLLIFVVALSKSNKFECGVNHALLFEKLAANERGLAQWRYSVIRQPGAATPD